MNTAKDIALISVFTALLIGSQFVLSGVSGVEIVTVLVTSFCFYFGIKKSLCLVNVFSLIRCFIFGFFPTAIILYLIYYNLFAIIIGLLGKKFLGQYSIAAHIIVVVVVCVLTCVFTLLDDVITPLFYGLNLEASKAYFIASLYTMLTQVICVLISTAVLFPVLIKCFMLSKIR